MANEQILDEIQNAIRAHGMWKMRLKTAIMTGTCDSTPLEVACDDRCDFGKWLYDESLPTHVSDGVPYKVIKRLHSEFHIAASSVLSNALVGDADKSTELFEGEFQEKSQRLIMGLNKWKGELKA